MIIKKLGVLLVLSIAMFIGSLTALPARSYAAGPAVCYQKSGFLGFPTWYEYLDVGPKTNEAGKVIDECAIIGPEESGEFSFTKALPRIGLAITEILLRVAGIVTVAFVMVGGFKYMTSQGEPDGLKKAQGTVINALIGLAISVLAVTIVSFIGGTLWQ